MTDQTPPSTDAQSTPQFRGSLVRTFVILLLLVSMLPVLVMGTATYIRARGLMISQFSSQLTAVGDTYNQQLTDLAATRAGALRELRNQSYFDQDISNILTLSNTDTKYRSSRNRITEYIKTFSETPTERIFDNVSLVDSAGVVILSSNESLIGKELSTEYAVRILYSSNQSALIYSPSEAFHNQLVLVTTQIYRSPYGAPAITLVGFSQAPQLINALKSAGTFFPDGRMYYYTANRLFVSYDAANDSIYQVETTDAFRENIEGQISANPAGITLSRTSFGNLAAISNIHPVSAAHASILLDVPENAAFRQIQTLVPFNLLLLAVATIISGLIGFFVIRSVVIPIVQLANTARTFSSGDMSFRTPVKRNDEIGLLAYSFNILVDQLVGFYRSLQSRVEEGTRQLQQASGIAQAAIAASSRSDMLRLTTQRICEELGYDVASIYTVDEKQKSAYLEIEKHRKEEGFSTRDLTITQNSAVLWVAERSQTRLFSSLSPEIAVADPALSPTSRSALVVPVMIEETTAAVLVVQSTQSGIFDEQSASIFQALSNQLSIGLRNLQLLESATINLQETSLMYRAGRQVTQAATPEQVFDLLISSFSQTNYVTFLLRVDDDFLTLVNLTDPRGTRLDQTLKGFRIPFQKGISRLSEGGVLIQDDLQKPSDFSNLNAYFERRGCRSGALIPVLGYGRLLAILAIGTREKAVISTVQMQPFANLAELVGASLERMEMLRRLDARLADLKTVDEFSRSLASQTDYSRLLEVLAGQVSAILGEGHDFTLANYNMETLEIEILHEIMDGETLQPYSYEFGSDLLSEVIRFNRPILVESSSSAKAHLLRPDRHGRIPQSWMGIPLNLGGVTVGALAFANTQREKCFTAEQLELLTILSSPVAASVKNTLLLREIDQVRSRYQQEAFLFDALLTHIPDQVFFKDQAGDFLRVSASMAKTLGVEDPSELVGKNDFGLLNQDSEIRQLEQEVLRTGDPVWNTVDETTAPDGGKSWNMNHRVALIGADGAVEGLLGITSNITDWKTAEELSLKRSNQLVTAAEIARDTSGTLNVEDLLQKSINLIRDRFGFYHASIFLLDPLGEYAILRESTGEAGRQLKLSNHRLKVGSSSIVGQTTHLGEPVVVNDVTAEASYYANPLLPDTRSELAIPLKVGDQLLGALDVQSTLFDAFQQEEINILQVLADQVAVAITNANLFAETQQHLSRHRLLQEITSAASVHIDVEDAIRTAAQMLHAALPQDQVAVFLLNASGELELKASAGYEVSKLPPPRIPPGEGILGAVIRDRKSIRIKDALVDPSFIPIDTAVRSEIAVPILYRGILRGVLNLESHQPAAYDENDQEFLTILGTNLGSLMANIELFDQIRLQVERQRQMFEITNKIRRSVDMETILQTSVSEICKALNGTRAAIHITPPGDDGKENPK